MKHKEIVLIKETRQKEFVQKVMDAISPYLSLKPSDKVGIKIDLSGSREIYSNTHYETVESLIYYLKENFDISNISVIEGSDGAYYSGKTTWDIFYKFKYKEVELNGAQLVNLDDLPHDNTMEVLTLSGKKSISFTRFDADYIISVIPPKTHNIFPLALSIPNVIGYVKPEDRVLMYGATASEKKRINFSSSDQYPQLILNATKNFINLFKELKPAMTLVDGLYGMEGKGPVKGSPVFHGFAIASEDIVLADALTAYIMGFDVDDIPYIYYAYREGLGSNRWQNVIGADPGQLKFPYRPHPFFPRQKLWKNLERKNSRGRDHTPHDIDRNQRRDNNRDNDRNNRRDYNRRDNGRDNEKKYRENDRNRNEGNDY